jgi:hypothetical protein
LPTAVASAGPADYTPLRNIGGKLVEQPISSTGITNQLPARSFQFLTRVNF